MGYLNNAAMRYMWAQGMDLNKSSEGQNMLIAALPAGDTQGDIVEIEGFSVNKNTGHKGQAIEVAKFLSSKKLEIINAKIGTIIPVRKSVQVEFLKNNPQMEPIIKMIHATAPVEYNINTAKIQKALTDFLTKAEANPSMDIKAMLDEAVNSVQ